MICKSLSIHKSQGMTVGEGKQFKKVVVHLPNNRRIVPGLELVAISRAVSIQDFAIGNEENDITKQRLKRIGNTPAYKARNEFLAKLKEECETSQRATLEAITSLDARIQIPFQRNLLREGKSKGIPSGKGIPGNSGEY